MSGRTPSPRKLAGRNRKGSPSPRRAIAMRRPSSTRLRTVVPSRAATVLASASKESAISMVVFILLTISQPVPRRRPISGRWLFLRRLAPFALPAALRTPSLALEDRKKAGGRRSTLRLILATYSGTPCLYPNIRLFIIELLRTYVHQRTHQSQSLGLLFLLLFSIMQRLLQ